MKPVRPERPHLDPTELIAQLAHRGFYVLGLVPSSQPSGEPSQPSMKSGTGAKAEERPQSS